MQPNPGRDKINTQAKREQTTMEQTNNNNARTQDQRDRLALADTLAYMHDEQVASYTNDADLVVVIMAKRELEIRAIANTPVEAF